MQEQYTFEYLNVPNKPNRYHKVPLHIIDQTLNHSSMKEISTSRKKKQQQLIKPILVQKEKEKKDKQKNFYHYSSIYNIKEFKVLTKSPIFNNQGLASTQKLKDVSQKVLISDFKRKVAQYITKKYQKSKNYQRFYADINQHQHSLGDLESQNSIIQSLDQQALNNSLTLNKYNIKTEYQQDLGVEVLFMDKAEQVLGKQILTNEKVQSHFLKFMEPFLSDDQVDYDEKMDIMLKQYTEIVNKMKNLAHKIVLPDNFIVNMSDYNDFYSVKEQQQLEFFNNKIEEYAEQIIKSIQNTSQITSPAKSSKKSSQILFLDEQNIDLNLQTEPTPRATDEYDQQSLQKNTNQKNRKKKPKQAQQSKQSQTSQWKESQQQQPQQKQEEQEIENEVVDEPQFDEEEILKQVQDAKKQSKKKMTKEEREEAKKRKKEMEKIQIEIQRIKKEKGEDFQYKKTDSDSDERFQRSKKNSQFQLQDTSNRHSRKASNYREDIQDEDDEESQKSINKNEQNDENQQSDLLDQFLSQSNLSSPKQGQPMYSNQQQPAKRPQQQPVDIWEEQKQYQQRKKNQDSNMQLQGQNNNPQQQQQQQQQQKIENKDRSESTKQQNNNKKQQNKSNNNQINQNQESVQDISQNQQNDKDTINSTSIHKTVTEQQQQQQQQQSQQQQQQLQQQQQQQQQQNSDNKSKNQNEQSQQKQTKPQSQTNSGGKLPQNSQKQITLEDINKQLEQRMADLESQTQSDKNYQLHIIDKLLSSAEIYDVQLKGYKIGEFDPDNAEYPNLEGEDDKFVFKQLFAWQKEIQQSVPRLRALNRNLVIIDDSQLLPIKESKKEDEDDKEEEKKKKEESDEDDD